MKPRASPTRALRHISSARPPRLLERLRTGQRVALRPLLPEDRPAYVTFVTGLSAETLHNRLLGAGMRVTDAGIDRLLGVDPRFHVAIAATSPLDDGAPRIVGIGRFALEPDGSAAEFAVTVADDWHRRGLGTILLEAIERASAARGVATLKGDVLPSNTAMLGLARKRGFTLSATPGDAHLVRVAKCVATPPGAGETPRDTALLPRAPANAGSQEGASRTRPRTAPPPAPGRPRRRP